MSTRLQAALKSKKSLTIFTTAGFPRRDDTPVVISALAKAGVDLIELGIPFSDPISDGPTIQASSMQALAGGMNLPLLLKQVREIRTSISVPLVAMGYLNPVLQFGVERFISEFSGAGIDGVILPDLPLEEFEKKYREYYSKNNLDSIFLVTARTPDERVAKIERLSTGFVYVVSSEATTGGAVTDKNDFKPLAERLRPLITDKPMLVGFGIHDKKSFEEAIRHFDGAILGSAFLRALQDVPAKGMYQSDVNQLERRITEFVGEIRGT